MQDHIDAIRAKLHRFTPENMPTTLPLLHRLLNRHYQTTVSVDIERAVLMTQHLRQTDGSETPMQIRRAEAVKKYLSERKIYFHDDNILGGPLRARNSARRFIRNLWALASGRS